MLKWLTSANSRRHDEIRAGLRVMHEDWLLVWQERCELKKQCEEWKARYERLHELLTRAQDRADRLLTELEKRSK